MSVDLTAVKSFFSSLTLQKLPPAIITFVVAYLASRLLLKVVDKLLARSRLEQTISTFLRSAIRILLWALIILIVASSLGIDVTSMIAILSVASLAVSLAVQSALSNLAGGVMLLSTHPFRVGDYVEVGGVSGTVQRIGMTYTTLATADQKEIFVPNSEISSSKIINYNAMEQRRIDFLFTASYGDAVEDVKTALRKASMLPKVLTDPAPFVTVNKYGDSSIEYLVRLWTATPDYWDVYYAVLDNVKTCFDEH